MKHKFPEYLAADKSIFTRQRVKRRKGFSYLLQQRSPGKTAYRPSGFGADRSKNLIDLVRQQPVKAPLNKKPRPFRSSRPASSASFFNFSAPFLKKKGAGKPPRALKDRKFPLSPGRIFSGIPPAPALGLAGLLAFSVLCLNWQGGAWPGAPAGLPEPGADGLSRKAMDAYTGRGPSPTAQTAEELIPLDLTETFAWETYRVKSGDSVSKIAKQFSISMDAVIASNGISNARRLREGETLRIPNMDGVPYTVKNGDSLSKISAGMGVPLEAILDANDIQSDAITEGTVLFIPGAKMRTEELKLALGELFVYPIRGRLTSPFGWRSDPISGARRYHAALDLAASMGTPIKAAMDGKVSVAGANSVYGNYVILSHAGGYQTMYAHMSRISVVQGASVAQGAKIGEVGSTGYSTGPHLHFAVYKNGRAVNPLDYLSP
jgi:murein DD-endopeptidase MepM/ murein hydrolase activator NlpD